MFKRRLMLCSRRGPTFGKNQMIKTNYSLIPYKGKFKVDTLSQSSVSSYLSCGLRWKLGKIDKVYRIVPRSYFVFGSAVHRGSKPFWLKGKPVEFVKNWLPFKSAKIDYGKSSWLALMNQGRAIGQTLTEG